jgi:hypothetical protein
MFREFDNVEGPAKLVRVVSYDPQVSESEWQSGLHVWVNFGGQPYHLPDGSLLGPMSFVRRHLKPS